MKPVRRKTRLRAIRGALRIAERLLVADVDLCLHVYQASGLISLFRPKGRKKDVLARFSWDPTETE